MSRTIRLLALAAATVALPAAASAQSMAPATAGARQFTIFIYESRTELARRADTTSRGRDYWASYAGFGAELQRAGVLRGGTALRVEPGTTSTVTVRGGATRVANLGHARSAETLGGYFVIEVATREEALAWAAKVPASATGAVEVRESFAAPTMTSAR